MKSTLNNENTDDNIIKYRRPILIMMHSTSPNLKWLIESSKKNKDILFGLIRLKNYKNS